MITQNDHPNRQANRQAKYPHINLINNNIVKQLIKSEQAKRLTNGTFSEKKTKKHFYKNTCTQQKK